MVITPVYAGLVALMFVVLCFRVIGSRRLENVALGDGGNKMLTRRLRAQGNFAEYAPLAIVLMALAELQGKPDWLIHGLGIVLLTGRLVHAFGVSQDPEDYRLRVVGMALTFSVLITGAVTNIGLPSLSSLVANG